MRNRKQRPFIYYEDLKIWEKTCMMIYEIATLFVVFVLFFGRPDFKQITLIMYIVLSQLGMYFGLYTSLRNFRSFLIWFGFGIVHLILFLIFKGNITLQMYRGNPSYILINTIPLLLLFQILRYISLKLQNREFVAPSRGGGPDLFENKNHSLTDFMIFIIYMASCGGLFVLWLSN